MRTAAEEAMGKIHECHGKKRMLSSLVDGIDGVLLHFDCDFQEMCAAMKAFRDLSENEESYFWYDKEFFVKDFLDADLLAALKARAEAHGKRAVA